MINIERLFFMKDLIIVGVGGFAREVFWHAQRSRGFGVDWRIKGFLDGDVKLAAEEYALLPEGFPVLGDASNYEICAEDVFTCAIGTPQVRRKLIEMILSRGGQFVSVVSELAQVAGSASIGQGVIITPNVIVNDHARIGDFAAINLSTVIGHDAQVGKYSCVMALVSLLGKCQLGEGVFVGGGALILPNAKVGDGAFIGAGSVVLKRVKVGRKVFGNPAIEI